MKPAPPRDQPRRGRPQLAADVARDHRVVSFLTRNEKATLVALAEGRDLSISSLCHELIIEGLARQGEAENNERGSSELPHGEENA